MRVLALFAVVILSAAMAYGEGNAPLAFQKHGKGARAVILVPGLDCGASVWDATVKALEGEYTIYTVTLAGFDGQPAIAAPYCDAWVEAIAKLVADEKLDKPILVGHSLGGNLALREAIAHPDLLRAIVLVDATPIFPLPAEGETMESRKAQMKAFADMIRRGNDAQFRAGLEAYLATAVTRAEDRKTIAAMAVRADRETHCGAFYELATTDLRSDLAKITVPVRVIAAVPPAGPAGPTAEQLPAGMKEGYDEMFKAAKDYAVDLVADSRHFIMYDQPARLQELLAADLAKLK